MQVVHKVKCDNGDSDIIGYLSDNMMDNEGKIIMGDKANCDNSSLNTDDLHSQIKEDQSGKE
jgi:hypothetical protein